MPYFPLFVDLTGKDCLIVGGGAVAVRKARSLLNFGAKLRVVDPEPSASIKVLSLTLLSRPYRSPEDVTGAAMVIAATDKQELNRMVAQDARAAGIPVNVVDDPQGCTFFFPALVQRGELVAGISTAGLCPRFSALLREYLDGALPPNLGEVLELLSRERQRLSGSERIQRLDSLIVPLLTGIFVP
ncbi:MAG: bifunctional precorrin-2 dehydrogenase/sirohydrochlorin ferrochelatase [Treponema sp.]|nr:bifunctional precorrin-2 dehydrogenase/sirohydrochlorin ferrochelatase [Treponema sp.]